MTTPLPTNPNLKNLPVYQPGRPIEEVARELGLAPEGIIKLASNENPLGPSRLALAAMRQALKQVNLYPDGNAFYLKQKLAAKLGVTPANLILGNGSNEVIELVGHALLGGMAHRHPAWRRGRRRHARSRRVAILLRGLSHRDCPVRRETGRRAGEKLRPRSRRDAGCHHAQHAHRLRRQSEQPHRHHRRPRGTGTLRQRRARQRPAGVGRGLHRISERTARLAAGNPARHANRTCF